MWYSTVFTSMLFLKGQINNDVYNIAFLRLVTQKLTYMCVLFALIIITCQKNLWEEKRFTELQPCNIIATGGLVRYIHCISSTERRPCGLWIIHCIFIYLRGIRRYYPPLNNTIAAISWYTCEYYNSMPLSDFILRGGVGSIVCYYILITL